MRWWLWWYDDADEADNNDDNDSDDTFHRAWFAKIVHLKFTSRDRTHIYSADLIFERSTGRYKTKSSNNRPLMNPQLFTLMLSVYF